MSHVNHMLVAVLMPAQIREREQDWLRPSDSSNKQNPSLQTARSSTCNYKCQQKLKRLICASLLFLGMNCQGSEMKQIHTEEESQERW